jgi:hypothetical protein
MSFLEELQKEVAKRNPCAEKRVQIEVLRQKAHENLNAYFSMSSSDLEQMGFLKGQLAAFDACLELFVDATERAKEEETAQWVAEEEGL